MKHWRITLAVLAALLAPLAMADEFKTINGRRKVTLKLFASAAAIQPSAAALEAGLMEQEQHYPCSAVLP